ncbi:MAG TPA: DNA polymerase III subunit gamma/tau [Candidatus Paceibacterota bacterium]|nr:DNA polymerase III subunit gamma/tau [Candidatus Paceibacterota bacterium]
MAHQSLYRQYRPQGWKDVTGQPQVTEALSEQIASGKVGHAYLFAGSRGLGKTSVARIFAREIGTTEKDLYEIDAASNNSVDDIRNLTENVYTLPFESPYKVYILDEAHMLSKGAWNAFLKTLEEPPAHAVFILATTELDKVPETVQSRCQVFTFKKPGRAELAKVVKKIAEKEGYDIEPSAADLIALLADGSYRDALSVLERALTVAQGKSLKRAAVEDATGSPKHALVADLAKALSEGNQNAALATVRKAADAGIDMKLYLSLVLDYLRAVLLVRHAAGLRKEYEAELGADEYKEVEAIASTKESKLTHHTLKSFLDAAARMRYASVASLPLELAILELIKQ